ncbi:histone deacetylase [Persicitalea jodogahamensis]|uniref:Histone deacetylase n=2 Tax=Persicitalea jodogahamensis TaxID=402147 RepID=A0A8J3D4F9_9BACT|nr:histone deacetylase [Persicitalea jodogahamensis]
MIKYDLIPEQLIYEGTCTKENFFCPEPIDEKWVLNVHDGAYWMGLKNGSIDPRMIRRIGFPLSPQLVMREMIIARGTLECCNLAKSNGIAMNVAGGTHHAFPDKGEGFCLLNDIGIAAGYLLDMKLAQRILIIDLDVHQGNGTAVMFQNEPRVFTFSMHGKDNYPLKKEKSDLDIPLKTGETDEIYLENLTQNLSQLFEQQRPDFAFYLAGVDILETDKLGHLSVSREGCRQRDEFVFRECKRRGIPVAVLMGGGYSPRLPDIVEAHCNTFREAQKIYF